MNPILFAVLPDWSIGLGIAIVVTVVVLAGYAAIQYLTGENRRVPEDDATLSDRLSELRRTRNTPGGIDDNFDRMVQGSLLGATPQVAAACVLLAGGVAAFATYLVTFDELYSLIFGLVTGFLVLAIFWLYRNSRRQAIQEQLPDGCFQLSRSLRAGLNLTGALRETTAYTPAPLAGLFDRLTVALSLGESTRKSVGRVADEARVTDFDLFAEVLILNAESGGNLPAMLDRLAASIRDRNQYRGYFRSVTALSRTTAIFLGLAFPIALILYRFLQPAMFAKFLNSGEGQTMLIAAIILEIIGIIWISFLLRRQDDY